MNLRLVGGSTLIVAAFIAVGVLKIQQAAAQVDATSSDAVATSSETATPADTIADTIPDDETVTSSTEATSSNTETDAPSDAASPPESDSVTPTESPPQGLTEVHVIGTKYVDCFTDGTAITSYPGDPAIDANFDKPNAPIPTHEGLTWDHTDGANLYDTPSGDLDVGDYALQPNGTYITNAPPFVSATSTPAVLGASTFSSSTSPDTSSASTTTTADPIDPIDPAATSADSATTSSDQ
jgi:hypothetical protein